MEKIIERFVMSEWKPIATPIEEPKSPEKRLKLMSDNDENAIKVPYREAIESLMNLMIGSRPNIAYAGG